MKPTTLALLLSIAVGASCLVSTRSDKYACKTQADCDPSRTCEAGYCVVDGSCPSVCNGGCDADGTCNITGTGDTIACPAGATCNITCTGPACGDITCSGAAKCTVNCVGDNTCNNITCGTADCTLTCNGTNACNDITCGNGNTGNKRGRCSVTCLGNNGCGDVTCSSACDCAVNGCLTSGQCGTLTCPRSGGSPCTQDGTNGTPCSDSNNGCSC